MNLQDYNYDRGCIPAIPDWKLAGLLGLSIREYDELSHRGLKELTDVHGEIKEYYIYISAENSLEILNKLNLDRYSYVRFRPEQVQPMLAR